MTEERGNGLLLTARQRRCQIGSWEDARVYVLVVGKQVYSWTYAGFSNL